MPFLIQTTEWKIFADLGHVQTASIFLLVTAKSAITHWMESSRVLKMDIPSVIDVSKNKN